MLQNERRLQKIGSSVLMSLPAEWIKTLGLKKEIFYLLKIIMIIQLLYFLPEIGIVKVQR